MVDSENASENTNRATLISTLMKMVVIRGHKIPKLCENDGLYRLV